MNTPATTRKTLDQWQAQNQHNFFDRDPHLASILASYGQSSESVRAFGALCAQTIDPLARFTNLDPNLPRLHRYDGFGNRVEQVQWPDEYHEIGRQVARAGILAGYREPGKELELLAKTYLFAHNGEAGHACPLACAAGLIKLLDDNPDVPPEWRERLMSTDHKSGLRASQFLTEIQGGSDVGANTVVATPSQDGSYRLNGEKWFCSVIDADLFLVSAREGDQTGTRGVGGFVVPRVTPDGHPNGFSIRRLKNKLGTRSMASAEIDLVDARGIRVGGFRDIVDVVLNTSRLFNAVVCTGFIQRSFLEAGTYAMTRQAFGQPIMAFPAVVRTVADIGRRAWGARATSFYLAHLMDKQALGQADPTDEAVLRVLVNLNKVWTALSATTAVRQGIEVLGGNGAIEDFSVLPRLLRDSIVCEAWEGGHNVLCAQTLRDFQRSLHLPLLDRLGELGGSRLGPRLERTKARLARLLDMPSELAARNIRPVVLELEPLTQAAVLFAQGGQGADIGFDILALSDSDYDPFEDPDAANRDARLLANLQ